ncbi:MAG: hypothetical protein RL564_96 [Pseudomonadota bacterium]|jgi:hypothetical protein
MTEQEKITLNQDDRTDTLDRLLRFATQRGGVKSNQIEVSETRWLFIVERFRQMQAAQRVADPETVPALIYAEFKEGTTRKDANVVAKTALVLDIDKDVDLERTRKALAGHEAVIYATKRSMPTALRVRVILPLASPIPARDWLGAYRCFATELALPGLDACAEKLSQPFLAPPGGGGYFEHLTGDWLNPAPLIAAARQAEFDALPEPEPITQTLCPVPAFDAELLPRPFRTWVVDIAHRMQCPIDFCAVGVVITLAGVIGAAIGIKPKRKDDWLIVPNCWGGVIGPPSKKKTPALQESTKPLGRLEAIQRESAQQAQRDAADSETKVRLKLLKKELENAVKAETEAARILEQSAAYAGATSGGADDKGAPETKDTLSRKRRLSESVRSVAEVKRDLARLTAPAASNLQERFRTNDATIEALHDLLSANPRGILVFRDELVGLLKGWEKQGREQDRAFYLEAWNGYGSFPLDRIGRGHVLCDNMCVSILGGTQPDKLRNYLYQARDENDGLLQRFQLLVYPDVRPFDGIVDEYPDAGARDTAFAIFETLGQADFTALVGLRDFDKIPALRFANDAQELFFEWYERLHRNQLENPDETPMMAEMLSKQPKTMASLALLFHLVDCADSIATGQAIPPVSLEAAARAADWCSYLEAHARRIYALAGNLQSQAAAALAERIGKGQLDDLGNDGFTPRDIYRKQWSLLDDREIVDQALTELVDAGWLLRDVHTAGWQQRGHVKYRVNPKVRRDG